MNAGPLIFLVLLVAVLWLLLIRPQRQRQAAQQAMIAQVAPGEEVVTVGGLLGVVKDVGDEEIRLEIAPGTEVRVAKQAISGLVRKDG
ncbi:MAG TPA: preprotein translocase subunit YajC [Gaiellaceae bacterium]|jgi:preprotein translocase subunit YajC|nr:preprotein translocase subunit YajC [Gaiellaceae bacterium]